MNAFAARVDAGSGVLRAGCAAASTCLVLGACASLLDIPEDPRLAPAASAPALEPGPAEGALPPGAESAAPGQSLSPSPDSELGGSGATIIAEQTQPSVPAATGGQAGSELSPDAGLVAQPEPQQPEPQQPEPQQPEPPLGSGGSSGQEPPAPPSACGEGRSQGPNGRCFALISTPLPWAEARDACEQLGEDWDLAVARDAALNTFLSTLIADEAWLGGTDQNTEGVWRWVDGGDIFWRGDETGAAPDGAFAAWNSTEPNGGGNSDCLRLVSRVGNEWADLECELLRSALCEGPGP